MSHASSPLIKMSPWVQTEIEKHDTRIGNTHFPSRKISRKENLNSTKRNVEKAIQKFENTQNSGTQIEKALYEQFLWLRCQADAKRGIISDVIYGDDAGARRILGIARHIRPDLYQNDLVNKWDVRATASSYLAAAVSYCRNSILHDKKMTQQKQRKILIALEELWKAEYKKLKKPKDIKKFVSHLSALLCSSNPSLSSKERVKEHKKIMSALEQIRHLIFTPHWRDTTATIFENEGHISAVESKPITEIEAPPIVPAVPGAPAVSHRRNSVLEAHAEIATEETEKDKDKTLMAVLREIQTELYDGENGQAYTLTTSAQNLDPSERKLRHARVTIAHLGPKKSPIASAGAAAGAAAGQGSGAAECKEGSSSDPYLITHGAPQNISQLEKMQLILGATAPGRNSQTVDISVLPGSAASSESAPDHTGRTFATAHNPFNQATATAGQASLMAPLLTDPAPEGQDIPDPAALAPKKLILGLILDKKWGCISLSAKKERQSVEFLQGVTKARENRTGLANTTLLRLELSAESPVNLIAKAAVAETGKAHLLELVQEARNFNRRLNPPETSSPEDLGDHYSFQTIESSATPIDDALERINDYAGSMHCVDSFQKRLSLIEDIIQVVQYINENAHCVRNQREIELSIFCQSGKDRSGLAAALWTKKALEVVPGSLAEKAIRSHALQQAGTAGASPGAQGLKASGYRSGGEDMNTKFGGGRWGTGKKIGIGVSASLVLLGIAFGLACVFTAGGAAAVVGVVVGGIAAYSTLTAATAGSVAGAAVISTGIWATCGTYWNQARKINQVQNRFNLQERPRAPNTNPSRQLLWKSGVENPSYGATDNGSDETKGSSVGTAGQRQQPGFHRI